MTQKERRQTDKLIHHTIGQVEAAPIQNEDGTYGTDQEMYHAYASEEQTEIFKRADKPHLYAPLDCIPDDKKDMESLAEDKAITALADGVTTRVGRTTTPTDKILGYALRPRKR